jgi:hypothetical protein
MKVSRELWAQVEPLLTAALDMEPALRAAWLAQVDATHPEAAPVLRRMLETHDRAVISHELETVPKLAPGPAWSSAHRTGERIGPFELVRPLGRGGMGEVWLARQADGRVARDVALKLPMLSLQDDVIGERFRRERDILARLEHPHIARLYDAGVTESGQPWLAMEYVEGLPLSEHVASRSLSIAQRLALFRQVLAAVAHAHRHLVVHRDLKPANILIDGSGQVRLLDFGIARLVEEDEGGGDLTRIGGRVMTLRYAAPEQVAAGTITTATDIYSLGVILHELVTGLAPYRAVREGKPFTDVMLLQEETSIPSKLTLTLAAARACGLSSPRQLARLVSGDLDAIVLKAMRRDPAQRYASVELLDGDIHAHLERRPVKARAGTWRYLAGRFALRHKLPFATAVAVLVTLAAGLVLADRERRVAVAEKARAERHFASVRSLANVFMFDVHGEIENLAGSLKAREMLVKTSLQYLDVLAKEAGSDPDVAVEVAIAYRKLADLKGDVFGSNLGDPDAALNNLRKARVLLDALDAKRPDDLKVQRERRELALALARLLRAKTRDEAVAENTSAVKIAERVVTLPGAGRDDRQRLASAHADLAYAHGVLQADTQKGLEGMRGAFSILEAVEREDPADRATRELSSAFYERASIITEGTSKPEDLVKGAELQARSNAVLEGLARDFPDNTNYRRNLARGYVNLAATERGIDRKPQARANVARGVEAARALAAAAPDDSGLQVLLLRALGMSCVIEADMDNPEKSIAFARMALDVERALPAAVRETLPVRANVAAVTGSLGVSQAALGLAADSKLPLPQRLALVREGRANLMKTRAFRQELVDRKIDAVTAALIVRQIDEHVAEIDAAAAKLAGT